MTHSCKRCLLPESVPGADLDGAGVCAFCRDEREEPRAEAERARQAFERNLEATLDRALAARGQRSHGRYDALVCLSGGKDSLYLLYKLKVDCGLEVLAFTTDFNIPPIAWSNMRQALSRLDIDHLVYRPSETFYRKLMRHLLCHQEERGAVYTVSYVYAPLFEGDALAHAADLGIPLVFAGYSPGQPERERMLYEFDPRLVAETDWTPPALRDCGEFSEDELGRFWNPLRRHTGRQTDPVYPRYIAPLHAWDYAQDKVMRLVHEKGLVARKRHANPILSNYPINWLLMYSDLKNFGYNPYAPEFAALIREGKASLAYWRLMGPIVNFLIRNRLGPAREITRSLAWLGLQPGDLRITQPRGAYDPPYPAVSDMTAQAV